MMSDPTGKPIVKGVNYWVVFLVCLLASSVGGPVGFFMYDFANHHHFFLR